MPSIIADGARLEFDEATRFFESKLQNFKTQRWSDVFREAHARGFMVAGAATDALVEDFRQAVHAAIQDGTTLEAFRREFDAIVARHGWVHKGAPAWRAKIIYNTNMAMAFSAGQYAQLTDPDIRDSYPFWRYVHGMHGTPMRPRPQHLAWNGLVLSCDDPFWNTHFPPNGWRCTCGVEAVSREQLAREGKGAPDTAPPIRLRPWRNPSSGAIEEIPDGIDPGFDYNPGKAWQQGDAARVGVPSAEDEPHEPGRAEPTPERASDEDGTAPPTLRGGPAAPPAPTPQQWLQNQIDAPAPDASARVVGKTPPAAGTERQPIRLSSDALHAMLADGFPRDELDALIAHLARPEAVLMRDGALVYVWAARDTGRGYAFVVVRDGEVVNGGVASSAALLAGATLLRGALGDH